MATFSTQFHATLDELVDFVERWAEAHHLYVTARHIPYRTEPVPIGHSREVLAAPSVSSIVFTATLPDLSAVDGDQFLQKNGGALVLHIGRLEERGLTESCLSTKASSSTWAKINADLKRHTTAGVIGTQERTGHSAFYRNHRVTAGARSLSERGTPLRQFAQSPVVLRPS